MSVEARVRLQLAENMQGGRRKGRRASLQPERSAAGWSVQQAKAAVCPGEGAWVLPSEASQCMNVYTKDGIFWKYELKCCLCKFSISQHVLSLILFLWMPIFKQETQRDKLDSGIKNQFQEMSRTLRDFYH